MINNGSRAHLIIDGVFDGMAGVQGNTLAFEPNRRTKKPQYVRGGTLDGRPVLLTTTKDAIGPFYTSRFRYADDD